MYRRFHDRFGTAGVVIGVIALIAALGGTAFAASKLNSTQKKEVSKIAKKEAQKYANSNPGAPGTNGTNGTNGKDGAPGAPGTNGKSVVVTNIEPEEGKCEERAGAEVKQEGAATGTEVCEGSPWTAGGTLPSGKTETGEWAMIADATGAFNYFAEGVSFNIPLNAVPTPHYIRTTGKEPVWNETTEEEEEVTQPACPGTALEPLAEPASLCIYASNEGNTATNPFPGFIFPKVNSFASGGLSLGTNQADPYGFGVVTVSEEGGLVNVTGTWAVTAP
jgi:hypothetical protein